MSCCEGACLAGYSLISQIPFRAQLVISCALSPSILSCVCCTHAVTPTQLLSSKLVTSTLPNPNMNSQFSIAFDSQPLFLHSDSWTTLFLFYLSDHSLLDIFAGFLPFFLAFKSKNIQGLNLYLFLCTHFLCDLVQSHGFNTIFLIMMVLFHIHISTACSTSPFKCLRDINKLIWFTKNKFKCSHPPTHTRMCFLYSAFSYR